ncbi:cyclin B [Pelomyxa schiedti]|nr:cyclin B [Pelomyxa schiedti]
MTTVQAHGNDENAVPDQAALQGCTKVVNGTSSGIASNNESETTAGTKRPRSVLGEIQQNGLQRRDRQCPALVTSSSSNSNSKIYIVGATTGGDGAVLAKDKNSASSESSEVNSGTTTAPSVGGGLCPLVAHPAKKARVDVSNIPTRIDGKNNGGRKKLLTCTGMSVVLMPPPPKQVCAMPPPQRIVPPRHWLWPTNSQNTASQIQPNKPHIPRNRQNVPPITRAHIPKLLTCPPIKPIAQDHHDKGLHANNHNSDVIVPPQVNPATLVRSKPLQVQVQPQGEEVKPTQKDNTANQLPSHPEVRVPQEQVVQLEQQMQAASLKTTEKKVPPMGQVIGTVPPPISDLKEATLHCEGNYIKDNTEAAGQTIALTASTTSVTTVAVVPNSQGDDDDIDKDVDDPMFCPEYARDIFAYCLVKEIEDRIDYTYMTRQRFVTPNMRNILVDWMVEVHHQFRLLLDTLYVAVMVVDKYLMSHEIQRAKLQLLGATALFIASKYEEVYALEAGDLVKISESVFKVEDLQKFEREVLHGIKYSLTSPTTLLFLRRFSRAAQASPEAHIVSKWLSEVAMADYSALQFGPSKTAAAAVWLSRFLCCRLPFWTPALAHYTSYRECDLTDCVNKIAEITRALASRTSHGAVMRKYLSDKMHRVANLAIHLYQMPLENPPVSVITTLPAPAPKSLHNPQHTGAS